ncbi:MAG: hypothetical protein OQJ81_08955 [Melioribacteraceae bacterium]|nr:hypothetical protein [Melioribacteraceae bacterium]
MKIIIILAITISNLAFSQGRNSNFEFSGIHQFWEIVKSFKANREPTRNEWNKLFNTPGYKVLVSSEFTEDFFKNNFRLVFNPNNKKELEAELKSGRNSHHLNHYIKVRDNKDKIRDQLKKLQSNRYNSDALKKTLEYLPQNRVSDYPPVSFVIFESNGRGSSPIVVDLAASIEWDFMGFLSHEYHHWYRNRQIQINLNSVSDDDRDIVQALSLIEAEGIADMVDKKDWYTKPSNSISEYARGYLQYVQSTPHIINQIDLTLQQILKNPQNKKYYANKILNMLPQRGHTTGYFMARLILEHFSNKELVKCVGNPFEFILLYDKASIKSGSKYPGFSDESIKLLTEMYAKYRLF